MKRILLAPFAAIAVACAASAETATPIDVVDGNNMPLVAATIDGVPCNLLLDTGASHTTFDLGFVTNRIPNANLQDVMLVGATNVKAAPKFLPAKSLTVGGAAFEIQGVMALDLSHLPAAVRRPVDGILGMDHISRIPCVISLSRRRLIWQPSDAERAGFHTVPSRPRGTAREVMATLPSGRTQPLLLDSGSSFTFLNQALWPAAEESADLTAASVNGSSAESNRRGKSGDFDFGNGFRLPVTPILTGHEDLNQIGSDVLRRVDLLLDGETVAMRPAVPAKVDRGAAL